MSKKQVDYKDQIKEGKLSKIPSWIKIILLKYWVAGAAFYFFGMGGSFIWNSNPENFDLSTVKLALLLGVGLGLMMEYITKPIVRMMRTSIDDTYRFNLINLRGTKSLFLNLFYGIIVSILSMAMEVLLIRMGIVFDPLNVTDYGVEPFSMGFCFLFIDFWFIFIKRSSIALYQKWRLKKELKRQQALLDENDVPVYGEIEESTENDHFLNDNEEK
ncbi:MAG: hypothetical protein ACI35W_04845 [Anaeroplasmataceae bacterium]